MMFHARGAEGGTILYHNGKLTKINFNEIGPKKNTTYPAWHPEGRFIAFSSNTTRQTFYLHGKKPIEVYDTASDLLVYDTQTGEVITDERFLTSQTLETFPAWSPDGRYLYYAAADAKVLPDEVENMHYHLLRVSFDQTTGHFGERTDTLYNAHVQGGSASHPRVSADGKYLLYTWSGYGTFPIWHQEADLKAIDLKTGEPVDVSVWNSSKEADSYHSWSSNGRWAMWGSRRQDGRYTHLYIGYFDEEGRAHKPFILPQKDPRYNHWRLKSYNVPEFIDGRVELPDEVVRLFDLEN
jgi:Tol biopolymer transport system component